MKRVLCIVTVCALMLCAFPAVSFADNPKNLSLFAYNLNTNAARQLCVKDINGELYAEFSDIMYLCGCTGKVSKGKNYVIRNDIALQLLGTPVEIGAAVYYPLSLACESLNTKITYDAGCGILCSRYYLTSDELGLMCMKCITDNAMTLSFVQGVSSELVWSALFMGYTYNVLSGMRVDALVGLYQVEIYEKALWGILGGTLEVQKESEEDWLSSLTDTTDDISKKYKEVKTIVSAAKDFIEFNTNLDLDSDMAEYDILTALFGETDLIGSIKKKLPQSGAKAAIEIAKTMVKAEQVERVYSNALYYTFCDRRSYVPLLLETSAASVFGYLDIGPADGSTRLDQFLLQLGKSTAKQVGGSVAKSFVNSNYIALEKLILDKLGIGSAASACEQMLACMDIQNVAIRRASEAYDRLLRGNASQNDALILKYSTILFIRAYQYAHEQMAVSDGISMSWFVSEDTMDYTKIRTTEYSMPFIKELAAIRDDELGKKVSNDRIDPSMLPEYKFDPSSIRVQYNPELTTAKCSAIYKRPDIDGSYSYYDICGGKYGQVIDSFGIELAGSDEAPKIIGVFTDDSWEPFGDMCYHVWMSFSTYFGDSCTAVYDTYGKKLTFFDNTFAVKDCSGGYIHYTRNLDTAAYPDKLKYQAVEVNWCDRAGNIISQGNPDPRFGRSLYRCVKNGDVFIYGSLGSPLFYEGYERDTGSKYGFTETVMDRKYVYGTSYEIRYFNAKTGIDSLLAEIQLEDFSECEQTQLTNAAGLELYEIKNTEKLDKIFNNLKNRKIAFKMISKYPDEGGVGPAMSGKDFLKAYK